MSAVGTKQDTEAERLELGYHQVLLRAMSEVRATMVNISTSSVTTAIFTLFAYGLVTGGTDFVWTWAIGFVILLTVVLMFSELGVEDMPIAGALYQWNSRLVGPKYGYYTAWLYIASQIAIVGAVAATRRSWRRCSTPPSASTSRCWSGSGSCSCAQWSI